MDLEKFQEFMLQSAARHDVEIGQIRESMVSITRTLEVVVNNQVHLQDKVDKLADGQAELRASLQDLERIVFRHVTDPSAHHT